MTGPSSEQLTGSMGTKVSIFLSILQAGASLLANPALGLKGTGQIVALIGYAGTLVRDIAVGADQLREVNRLIGTLIQEHRAPTDAEWARWEGMVGATQVVWARVGASLE